MKQKYYPTALTIAGSDSGGGAGIQADLKTFSSLGVFGTSVITAITAQNTIGVRAIQPVYSDIIESQCDAVCSDIHVDACKLGMLHAPETVRIVSQIIRKYAIPIVITDPVMVATSGDSLIREETIQVMESELFPVTTLLTPNIHEASILAGIPIDSTDSLLKAGEILLSRGCKAVLMKGGHFQDAQKTDILMQSGCSPVFFSSPTIPTLNTHGTGCTLSSAIAAFMALKYPIREAVEAAKEYITNALKAGEGVYVGAGHGPVNHFFNPKQLMPFYDDTNLHE
ncbi:MAG: bifunctional hydroxymethylpyrimidine kinase/phosphomethylpyrimidine kinase [Bacteroidales bacterium]